RIRRAAHRRCGLRTLRRQTRPQDDIDGHPLADGGRHRADRAGPELSPDRRLERCAAGGLAIVQGLGVGGEWGGSVLLAMEWAKPNRRGLAAAWPQAAVPIGLLLANGAIALTMVCMPHQQFMTWGWRVPFLLSVVMFGVGIYIRRRVVESPAFSQV